MSVTKYQYYWWSDEDPFETTKQKNKRADERAWKRQVEEEIEEMETEDE